MYGSSVHCVRSVACVLTYFPITLYWALVHQEKGMSMYKDNGVDVDQSQAALQHGEVFDKSKTRRNTRKRRVQLTPGDVGVKGMVVSYNRATSRGFIAPYNVDDCASVRNAPRISFYMSDVPRDRQKCVGVGRIVYFDVVEKGSIKRRGKTRSKLAAVVRSSRLV